MPSLKNLIFLFLCASVCAISAKGMSPRISCDTLSPSPVNKKRLWIAIGSSAALWTGSFVALNEAWYAGYPRSGFHFFNDNDEWKQMDKAGHVWTAYQLSRLSAEMWEWAGISKRNAAIAGGISGVAYQGIIEIQDAFSDQWGFSWGDLGANLFGAGAYVFQELGWKEQRIQVKMGYSPYHYPAGLAARRDQLFGKSVPERILKDYNSQTYWISANLAAFMPASRLPEWLNISIGYNADGMLGARSNEWIDEAGNTIDRSDIPRVGRFYLSPDIDLSRIRTKSKLLHSVLFALNMIKIPAPAIEVNSQGKLKLHAIRF